MKLRLGIQRVGSIVFGRVLEQDEDLRIISTLANGGKIVKSINSSAFPCLGLDGNLWVRGCCAENDDFWFARNYKDDMTAIVAVNDIKMLVAKVNSDEPECEVEDCGLEIVE